MARLFPQPDSERCSNGKQIGAIRKLDVGGKLIWEKLLAVSDVDHFYTYSILEYGTPERPSDVGAVHKTSDFAWAFAGLLLQVFTVRCGPCPSLTLCGLTGDGFPHSTSQLQRHSARQAHHRLW